MATFMGKPCRNGHAGERYEKHPHRCCECRRQDTAARYVFNREERATYAKKWKAANRERWAATMASWQKSNAAKCRESSNRRYAEKLNRMPSWADRISIGMIYRAAQIAQRTLGAEIHVDHDIPMQGELVSGLHIACNLRLMFAKQNRQKSNKFIAF